MKFGLIAGAAMSVFSFGVFAADLPMRAPAAAPAAVVGIKSWTGCYAGVGAGYTWLRNSSPLAAGLYDGGKNQATSSIASVRIGCDYQISNVVVGVFGAFDKGSAKGRNDFYPVGPGFPEFLTTKASWIGSAGGRVGYLLNSDLLAYVKGGIAWTKFKHTDYDINPVTSFYGRADSSRTGWTMGGGLEYALVSNWSLFAEYNFADFGSKNVTLVDGVIYPGSWENRYSNKAHSVTVGLQYKLN